MDENAKMSLTEEYLIIWKQLWAEARHKQPLYDKLDQLWKSMTTEEKTNLNKILREQ